MTIVCILIGCVIGTAMGIGICEIRERIEKRRVQQEPDERFKIPVPPGRRRKKA